jgi:ATP-binding cassette subfamily C protein LapB
MIRALIDRLLASQRTPELLASTVAINILALGSSLYSTQLLNRYVTIGLTPTLLTLTFGVLLAIFFEVMLRKQRQCVLINLTQDADTDVSERVFKAFSTTRYEPLSLLPVAGRREALSAPATMQQLTSTTNMASVLDLPFTILFVVAALMLYWPLGIFSLITCGMALLFGVLGERKQRAAAEEHSKASSRAQQLGQFLLTASEALRCLPLRRPLSRRWSEVQGASLNSRRDGMVLQANLQQSIQTIGQLLTVVVYAVGAMAVVRGDLTTGALVGANILASRAFAVCSRAAYLADPLLRAGRADAALRQVEAIESESSGGVTPARLDGQCPAPC